MERHRTRNAEIAGSMPAASSIRQRLLRLSAKAARIRGSVAQVAAQSIGIRQVAISSIARSSAPSSESRLPL